MLFLNDWKGIYRPCFSGIKSEMAVPLIYLGDFCGVINLESEQKAFFTNQALLQTQKVVENTLAIYWESLFSKTTGPMDLPGGADISGYCVSRPCVGPIGGDFQATVRIDSRTAGIVLGDGEGHGVTGALNMLPLITAFKTYARDSRSTKHVLGKMLAAAREMHVRGTAIYFILTKKAEDKWLLFGSSAGHPLLIIVHQAGGHTLFPRQDLANFDSLGFLEETQMGEDIAELHNGDLIIGLTDGVIEAANLSQRAAELAVLGAVSRVQDAEPEIIAKTVESWATTESRNRLLDDATIIVVRVGAGGRISQGNPACPGRGRCDMDGTPIY